jgi:hypothetical protein
MAVVYCTHCLCLQMILDDHEITDDAGDVPEHVDQSTWQYFVIGAAYQVSDA